MKRTLLLSIFGFFLCINASFSQETLESLNAMKAEKEAMKKEAAAKIAGLDGELADLQKKIDILSGWVTGYSGLIGFSLDQADNWIGSPNPNSNSSKLGIGITAFANKTREKSFWFNKLLIDKQWLDIDISDSDHAEENDGLFDNGTVDILNLSSLYGYKLNNWIALSGLGELNTSVENFLAPGTLDFGVGATLTPIENLVVVIHPLNYHVAFSGLENLDTKGSLGAKVRADYAKEFMVTGKKVLWSSTFTTFIPYKNEKQLVMLGDGTTFEAGLFEYTWLNKLNFEVWNGIGVGISLGLRKAEFESKDSQKFYSLGLSYSL
ncbi:MAG TPA: DUF3078 domain-containing protein [Saprospiraceae bacterium]|nr:DUF3078 domain-containing protein [Saprospiraceae bacterium]MCB9328124.1 DUF3078 domain-containing protein [Lewinellaceae bacterium]HPK09891.1 DUF3078 domain-containing protein [Saprospiraceae bacterium]HRX30049.1 DUF3078 domain-containing protein [Saprospiraceae bacterium]